MKTDSVKTEVTPSVVMLTSDRQIDRRILLSADSLELAGWEVNIVAMPLDVDAVDDRRVVRIGADTFSAKRENHVLSAYRWVRAHLPMNSRLMRWMKRFAWRYLVDQETFYSKLFRSTAYQFIPHVFVANDLPMLPIASELAKSCGARLVYDSHELYSEQEFSNREKRRWREIESIYINSCDVVITVNQSIATELENRYGIKNVQIISNAERSTRLLPTSRGLHEIFSLPKDKKILLLQGGLTAGRNLEVLIGSMQLVQNPSVVLVVLGDGVLSQKLQKIVKQNALTHRVYFHSAVPQDALLELTATADGGVIPYQPTCLNNYYCTPNKLFEFIAAGIPILATDLPEIRKVVHEQGIGLVGQTHTIQAMALLIDDFFSDEKRLALWRDQVSLVRQRICWEQESTKLVEIYEALR